MQKNTLATIIFATTPFLFFVLVLPQYDISKLAGEAISSRQALLNDKKAIFDNIHKLNLQVQSRQTDINKIKTFIPTQKHVDEVITGLQKITEQSGLQLSGLTISEGTLTGAESYKKLSLSMNIASTYPAFVNFLKVLEQSLRLYDISEIAAGSAIGSTGNIDFALKMNTYYLK